MQRPLSFLIIPGMKFSTKHTLPFRLSWRFANSPVIGLQIGQSVIARDGNSFGQLPLILKALIPIVYIPLLALLSNNNFLESKH